MRQIIFLGAFFFTTLSQAASPQSSCSVDSETYSSKDVTCTLPVTSERRAYEFIARFSGGHDDTQVSIQTSLRGQALACDDGSKKESRFEDGDIKLSCKFSVVGKPGSDNRLQVLVRWSHAEYTNFQLITRD